MDYSFNTQVAKEVGLNAASIYNNIKFWCAKNRANDKHFHDGQYWTYNSVKAMEIMFDFLSPAQIRTSLKKLEDSGFIKSGNFNKAAYDRTKWYCDLDKLHLSYLANGIAINSEPIPDINTDNKQDSKQDNIDYIGIHELYNTTMTNLPNMVKMTNARKKLVKKFFDDFGFNMERFENYLDHINTDKDCAWMVERRPMSDGSGRFWKAKGFDYFVSEKCYLDIKESMPNE